MTVAAAPISALSSDGCCNIAIALIDSVLGEQKRKLALTPVYDSCREQVPVAFQLTQPPMVPSHTFLPPGGSREEIWSELHAVQK
jgi:hypothetical protein